jgi:hypothetical protein
MYNSRRYNAAVCKRGHVVEDRLIDPETGQAVTSIDWQGHTEYHVAPKRCGECGAAIAMKCINCGNGFPGGFVDVLGSPSDPQPFCEECGSPLPWATRRNMVWHLQNRLGDDDLDQAVRLKVT